MDKKKRIILIGGVSLVILALLTLAVLACVKKASMSGTCGANLTWVYDGKGTLTITGTGAMTNWTYHGGRAGWANFRDEITIIIVEDGVTSIGDYAFEDHRPVEDIELPDSLSSIGEEAFFNCGIKTIKIPNSVTSIGRGAFMGCEELKRISIPENVQSIGHLAFSRCKKLEKIKLSEGITVIGACAFESCTMLKKVVIPKTVTEIGEWAFKDCSKLTGITFLGDLPFELEVDDEGGFELHGAFMGVKATAYWPGDNDSWIGFPTFYLCGEIEWVPI